MLPRKWSPTRELTTLNRDLDEMFGRFLQRDRGEWPFSLTQWEACPAIDLAHTKEGFRVRVELPGIDPSDVDLSLRGRVLTIKGERKEEKETTEEQYYLKEIAHGAFERSVTLPEGVDTEKITASFKNGILEISIPSEAVEEPRKIEIVSDAKSKKLKAA